MRIADVKFDQTKGVRLGGFEYSQTKRRAGGGDCKPGNLDCLGDMANGFSSFVHSVRDRELASKSYKSWITEQTNVKNKNSDKSDLVEPSFIAISSSRLQGLMSGSEKEPWLEKLDTVMSNVEEWRQDFNCALYAPSQWLVDDSSSTAAAATTPFPRSPTTSPSASPFPSSPDNAIAPVAAKSTNDSDFESFCQAHYARAKKAPVMVQEPWRVFGDPATPVLAAREGDPIQIRLIQGAQEAQHIFTMNGVKWHRLPDSRNSGFVNAQPLGISEHFEFDIRIPSFGMPHADYLYFGSSVDQLWDGMWGLMRAFQGDETLAPSKLARLATGQTFNNKSAAWLPKVPGAKSSTEGDGEMPVCQQFRNPNELISIKSFEVNVLRACDIAGGCDKVGQRGISYSVRHGISDPNAVIYVLSQEQSCQFKSSSLSSAGCFTGPRNRQQISNRDVLNALQAEFNAGRPVEPLVLRAAAGQCITVKLRNHLPQVSPALVLGTPLEEKDAYHNFLPMIADGFNLNQFKMSNSVGLSVPRLAQNPVSADGSNAGLNSAALLASKATPNAVHKQGSLVAPCSNTDNENAVTSNSNCSIDYVWSATDIQRIESAGNGVVTNEPVEFGALPLRSFGDVVKHPAHGLVGAMVIGQKDSDVCPDKVRAYPLGGVSRNVCDQSGKILYGDHVLVMQDAVSAVQHGFPVPDLKGAEEPDDYGVKAINYKTEPLWARRGGSPSVEFGDRNANFDYTTVFSSKKVGKECESGAAPNGEGPTACDPETVVIKARVGDSLRLHFVHPGGHTRQQGLTLAGHGFNPYPWASNSHLFAPDRCQQGSDEPLSKRSAVDKAMEPGCLTWQGVYNGFGPMMGTSLGFKAGGSGGMAKDYLLRTQASFLLDGGLWGILRVSP